MIPVNRCSQCAHWAPVLRQTFLGMCGHPERPGDRCTDRLDTCALFTDDVKHRITRFDSNEADAEDDRTTRRKYAEDYLT